jgi:hypothetical protein
MEHAKLAKNCETKGAKNFHNAKIQWILMLAPTKCVLLEYKALMVKIINDNVGTITTKNNYKSLCNYHIILELICVLLVMEAM